MDWIEITLIVLICVIILMMVLFGFNRRRSTSQRQSKSSVSRTSPTIQQDLELFAKQEKYKRLKGHVDYFKGTEFQDASKLFYWILS